MIAGIVAGIEAAIQLAPGIESVVTATKNWVGSLFGASVITADQQNQLNAHVDAVAAAWANGTTPPEFQVQADPSAA